MSFRALSLIFLNPCWHLCHLHFPSTSASVFLSFSTLHLQSSSLFSPFCILNISIWPYPKILAFLLLLDHILFFISMISRSWNTCSSSPLCVHFVMSNSAGYCLLLQMHTVATGGQRVDDCSVLPFASSVQKKTAISGKSTSLDDYTGRSVGTEPPSAQIEVILASNEA